MRDSILLYPAVNVLHIVAAAAAAGGMLLADLRLLGAGESELPPGPLFRHALTVAVAAAAVSLGTGVLLLAHDPLAIARNPFFQAKLGLLVVLLANAIAFRLRARGETPGRLAAAISLTCWLGVLVAGGAISYW